MGGQALPAVLLVDLKYRMLGVQVLQRGWTPIELREALRGPRPNPTTITQCALALASTAASTSFACTPGSTSGQTRATRPFASIKNVTRADMPSGLETP